MSQCVLLLKQLLTLLVSYNNKNFDSVFSVYSLDEQRGSTTPSRKREREEPSVESPGKRRKRESMCTPAKTASHLVGEL